jgi:CelD/BcsL family acetyltransferase involved in cellulose biosynthesis
MSWRFEPAAPSFKANRELWDSFNRAGGNHILLDSGFVSPLLQHFGGDDVVLGSNANSSDPGAALFVARGKGRWETFQPSQAPIGMFLLGAADSAGDTLQRLTRKLPGYALELSVLQQDPDYSSVHIEQNRPGLERVDYIQTARITMSGTFEEYWKERGSNLRHNLARRRRRMAEKNKIGVLIARRAPSEVEDAIREYGRLESAGWKAENGTAVNLDNAQGRFYRDVFEHFCARDEAVIYQFVVDGSVVASDLCLVRNGMMIVLKTAYDESFNEFSPALMMREDIMKQLFEQGQIRVVEFYGRVMEWHTRWTGEVRTLYHVNCLRHLWVAPLKEFARRFK